jgi:hypothetical protein
MSYQPEFLATGQLSLSEQHILASPSSSIEILEVLSASPLAAMKPEASSHP